MASTRFYRHVRAVTLDPQFGYQELTGSSGTGTFPSRRVSTLKTGIFPVTFEGAFAIETLPWRIPAFILMNWLTGRLSSRQTGKIRFMTMRGSLRGLRGGDEQAYEALIGAFQQPVYNLCA